VKPRKLLGELFKREAQSRCQKVDAYRSTTVGPEAKLDQQAAELKHLSKATQAKVSVQLADELFEWMNEWWIIGLFKIEKQIRVSRQLKKCWVKRMHGQIQSNMY
jgi:hypothetical protein